MNNPTNLKEAALWYAAHGFAVFPLEERGKRPIFEGGLNNWTVDAEKIERVWSHGDYNIGITCGTPSHGLLVLDFDIDEEDGEDGTYTLGEWEGTHGELPSTVTAITGRGGMHYLYYTDRTNIRPSVNKELGVDIRSDGGYIVAPPSIHPNGTRYRWMDGCAPWEHGIAKANGNVYDLLDYVQRNGGRDDGEKPKGGRFELPEVVGKGERNDVIHRYGCSLRSRGYHDDAIAAMLNEANRKHCKPPMSEREMKQIISQVCKLGPGHDGEGTFIGEKPNIGRPGAGVSGDESIRGPKGGIKHNVLARKIINDNFARHIDGAPAVWTGSRWEFGKQAFDRMCLRYADDAKREVRNEVFSYIQSSAPHVESANGFDGRYYVQFRNCTFDVESGEVVEPNERMFIIGTLPVDYNPDAPYGDADRFIDSLADDDENTARAMREIIGMCMCSMPVTQQSPFLIGKAGGANGNAANGKSTFLKVLRALLGSNNTSMLDLASLGEKFQSAHLIGKLANIGDDIPDGFLQGGELSIFKKLVDSSGIHTDIKYGDGFDFKPSATLIFSMNAVPHLSDTTDGVFRRLAFIPFRRRFEPGMDGYDPHIAEKMSRPENLQRLALLGLMELPSLIHRNSITKIPDMAEEVEAVRIDNDVVRRWIAEEGITESDLAEHWVSDVYQDFDRWCSEAGERYQKAQRGFTKTVLAVFGRLSKSETRERTAGRRGQKFTINLKSNV